MHRIFIFQRNFKIINQKLRQGTEQKRRREIDFLAIITGPKFPVISVRKVVHDIDAQK